jgi:aspartate kinase
MKVFKFGGASVRDADAVRNIVRILQEFRDDNLIIVISAMGKTTNALEAVVEAFYRKDGSVKSKFDDVRNFHLDILNDLFPDRTHKVYNLVNNLFVEIEWVLEDEPEREYDFTYDQVVSFGELISTRIVSEFLNDQNLPATWLDARDVVRTDNTYREGKVDWDYTAKVIPTQVNKLFKSKSGFIITQGFIGSTSENYTTTLGREGSDYTASIFAFCMNAEYVIIWKDVPGVLNADPKFFSDAQKLERMSYHDAIELAYFGASVIHPKTIKPLENRDIRLYVKSFMNPELSGTIIGKDLETKPLIPSFIFKDNQMLVSISAKDFSFIAEHNLSGIFALFAQSGIKMNLMQNSAISFSVCIDNDTQKVPALLDSLMQEYKVLYNQDLQLYTVRHYYPSTIDMLTTGKEVLLEQRSRHTAQFVTRQVGK